MSTFREEARAEMEKMKGRPFKAKLEYFWDYYKVHVIAVVLTVLIVGYIIHTVVSAREYALFIVAVNSADMTGEFDDLWTGELTELLEIDTKEYEVYIDSSMQYGAGNSTSNSDYATAQKLTALLTSRAMDIMIADITVYEQYAQNKCFVDLRDIFSEEELEALEGRIYYTDAATYSDYESTDLNVYEVQSAYVIDHHDPSTMKDPVPVGIFADDETRVGRSEIYAYLQDKEDYQGYPNEGVMGIFAGTERQDAAIRGLKYLMNE